MNDQIRVNNPFYTFFPLESEGFDRLAELALDMRWSWNHYADEIWRQIDPDLWAMTHNPWVLLQTISRSRLESLLAQPDFRREVDRLVQAKREASESPCWFQKNYPNPPLTGVAYFSMEFMLSEALPIYSGGLGNVAGDQLKAASDLGVPVVGVGLLYQQGYFRQVIDREGAQQALFPYNDPGQLPITPVRGPDGEWLRLGIDLPGYSVWLRAWQVQVGRVKLYLLDSNDAANIPSHRGITSELYGGGQALRIQQEIALGIGGWRLLRTLGLRPELCHLNEGHAAFAVLERARNFMQDMNVSFETALTATRAGNLFTTHTAVPAGFDRFPPDLVERYLGAYARRELGIAPSRLLGLGRANAEDQTESFNMAYLAVRGSGAVNGVSKLHGRVSRRIFSALFPRQPEKEVPIGHVTNGVHAPSWASELADDLWIEAHGVAHWPERIENIEHPMRETPDGRFWQLRNDSRKALVFFARERLALSLAASGAAAEEIRNVGELLNPEALTLGFARRFATYKRPNLLLHNPDRLRRLLTDAQRPVQLIIAGKAHPADVPGQAMIQEWVRFIRQPDIRPHAIFLNDYDMLLTERLVQGVDVWINTPRRPWEACGTSGMKVLVNGGINLSELDGWWAEAFAPEVGWALGDGLEHGDDPAHDAFEAEALYDLLEHEVIPEFYDRDARGFPSDWVARMRASMTRLSLQYSADRTVREYTEAHYLPMAQAFSVRSADRAAVARQAADWLQALDKKWNSLHIEAVRVETEGDMHRFEAEVFFGDLDPNETAVELYAEGDRPHRPQMTRVQPLPERPGGYLYRAEVTAIRPADDYTARVIPRREGIQVPLETAHILWQK